MCIASHKLPPRPFASVDETVTQCLIARALPSSVAGAHEVILCIVGMSPTRWRQRRWYYLLKA